MTDANWTAQDTSHNYVCLLLILSASSVITYQQQNIGSYKHSMRVAYLIALVMGAAV